MPPENTDISPRFIDAGDTTQSCSFCGWGALSPDKERVLIYHTTSCICSKCVAQCHEILFQRGMLLAGDIEYFSWFAMPMVEYDHMFSAPIDAPSETTDAG